MMPINRDSNAKRLNLPVDKDFFILIPKNCTKIKIDVGLGSTAIHAIKWLKDDDHLFVVGFEPLVENTVKIQETLNLVENSHLKNRLLIVQCALGSSISRKEIYVTKDRGLASFLEPISFPVKSKRMIEIETLDNFIKNIRIEKYHKIDYIKIDCQGYDNEVLKGAQETILNTAVVSCESESSNYKGANSLTKEIEKFFAINKFEYINKISLKSKLIRKLLTPFLTYIGPRSNRYEKFINKKHNRPNKAGINIVVIDPTFVNSRYSELVNSGEITAHQFN